MKKDQKDCCCPCDESGFLTGSRVPWQRGADVFEDVRDELKGMRADMAKARREETAGRASAPNISPQSGRKAGQPQSPPLPAQNTAQGQTAKNRAAMAVDAPKARQTPKNTDGQAANRSSGQQRDAKGRFGGGGSERVGEGGGSGSVGRALSGAGDALRGADFADVDPAFQAAKDVAGLFGTVRDVATPLARGVSGLFGRKEAADDEKPVRKFSLMRRIFGELKAIRTQDGTFHKREMKGLKAIEEKPVMSSAASEGGGFGLGISRLLSPLLGGLGRILKFGGGLAKRLPWVGALAAGGGILSGLMGGDAKQAGAGAGMLGGAVGGGSLGAAIGTAILPGLGTVVGGLVGAAAGSFFGEKAGAVMGEWLGKVDWAAIGDTITSTWDKAVSGLSKLWEGAKTLAMAPPKFVARMAGRANEAIRNKTGVDIGAGVTRAAGAVREKASSIGGAAWDKMTYAFGGEKGARKAALASEMVKSGITDPKEQAMFMAQMDHESGGFRSMEESFKYSPGTLQKTFGKRIKSGADAQALLAAGPEAVAERVYGGRADLGNTQAGDGFKFRGRGYTQLTGRANYAAAGKALGVDLEKNPDMATDPAVAARIATWYWKNRVGSKGASGDVASVTKRINGGMNGFADRNAKFSAYQGNIAEVNRMASDAGAIMGASPAPVVPALPKPPAIETPVRAQAQRVNVAVKGGKQDVPQDMRDRRIAHIATGGLGA